MCSQFTQVKAHDADVHLVPSPVIEDRISSATVACNSGDAFVGRRNDSLIGAVAVALIASGLLAGNSVLALLGLVAVATIATASFWPGDVAIVVATLMLLGAATLAGIVAAALGVDLVAGITPWAVATTVLLTASAVARSGRARKVLLPRQSAVVVWPVYVPAVVAAAIGVAQSLSTDLTLSWALDGTDLAQHVLGLDATRDAGMLSYAGEGYPRGFHMLAAMLTGSAPAESGELLAHDLRFVAACSWLALGLLALTAAAAVLRLAQGGSLTPRQGVWAATSIGGLLVLANAVIDTFVYMGAVPSLLALTVLLVVPLIVGVTREQSVYHALVAASAALFLLAHLWPPLVLAPVLALGAALPPLRSSKWMPTERRDVAYWVTTLALLGAAAPALLGVAQAGGTSLAAIPGELPRPPLLLLVVGAVALTARLARRRDATTRAYAGAVVGLAAGGIVLLAGAGNGLDLSQYYPRKMTWFLTVTVSPLAFAAFTLMSYRALCGVRRATAQLGSAARVARIVLAAAVVAASVAFVLPQLAAVPSSTVTSVRGAWDDTAGSAGRERFNIAQDYGERFSPAVTVPVAVGQSVVFDRHSSYVVSKLIAFETGQPHTHGRPHGVCHDVARASGGRDAVVITKLDPKVLRPIMQQEGCGDVRVVRIPGAIRDTEILQYEASSS